MRIHLLFALAASACVASLDDPSGPRGGKADGDGTCADPHYGDGTCQVDLGCGIPDIDCFVTFATDAEAGAWLTARYPVGIAPEGDPVHVRARALAERAWELYKSDVPLGRLADQRIGVVVIEDYTINAFALADGAPGKVGLSIQINRGLLASTMTDDEIVGVLLHELAHIVRLHVIREVKEKIRRFYLTSAPEPIGATQLEHAKAREAGIAWRTAAVLAGSISSDVLGDAPVDGWAGQLLATYNGRCNTQVEAVRSLGATMRYDELAGGYVIDAAIVAQVANRLASLRACAATDSLTLRMHLASLDHTWGDDLATDLPTSDPLYDRPVLEAILALAAKRSAMRAAEADLAASGAAWTTLRFYSYEEEADDVSARISTHHTLGTIGVAGCMLAALGANRPACEAALAAGTPAYPERRPRGPCRACRGPHARPSGRTRSTDRARR
jgi:hypothetical protein